ncbi:hypothetical protein AN642_01160 [Epulopiscium sp. SCG-B10WGA-EpuloA2]|nr:hypothetical protein AN642_01160 [Epulopiscium sp. SCG-B10WGA-EpuloA2]
MKNLLLCLTTCLLSIPCINDSVTKEYTHEPFVAIFKGIIEEIYSSSAIVTPNDDQTHILLSGDKVEVGLSNFDDNFIVGDEIVVYYTGEIMESYPLQINEVDIIGIDEFERTINSEPAKNINVAPIPIIETKAKVNIEGIITEVSADGKSFKLDNGKWIKITDDTKMGIDGPTAVPKDIQFFEDTFSVGNSIAGFTENENGAEIIAYAIYTNWN